MAISDGLVIVVDSVILVIIAEVVKYSVNGWVIVETSVELVTIVV